MLDSAKNFSIKRALAALYMAALVAVTGCHTAQPVYPSVDELRSAAANAIHSEKITLREGDVIKIAFPTAPTLNSGNIPIMRDGTIALPTVGVVRAAGKSLAELQDELVKLYSAQLESKQITVELVSASFPIFVTGAVLRPTKVLADRPMTVLQAIMEAGGPDYTRANLRSVTVLRRENGHLKRYGLDVKDIIKGYSDDSFYMQPDDIIYVREKFTWF